jgi:hypothetical protein
MRKVVLFMMLVLSLFLKAFEARLESADLSNIEISHPEEIPVQGVSQIDLFKRFFVAISPETDYECEEELKKLKADAMVLIDSETDSATIRVGNPFFLVKDGSKIVEGTLIKFFSSCGFGRVGLLSLKEKIDGTSFNNGLMAFAQKKPSSDVIGSVMP